MSTDLFCFVAGSGPTPGPVLVYPSEMDGVPNISIPTFAMAAYKLKGSIWMKKEVSENQVMNSLVQAADKWLRLVQVNHPDHQFFKSHGTYYKWIEWYGMPVIFPRLKLSLNFIAVVQTLLKSIHL